MSKPLVSIITGNSNSGSACIKELFEKYSNKVNVRAVFRTEEKAISYREKYPNLEIVTNVDASQPESLTKAFKGTQYALIVTPHDHTKDFSNDADLTANMINQAVKNGVEYIVLVASFTVNYPEQLSLLSARFLPSEKLLEKLGKETNLKWTVLRGGFFMENVLPVIKNNLKTGSEIHYANIQCPMVDTRDIGKCAAACLASENIEEHNQKCYEMNGPEIVTGEKMASVLSEVLGRQIEYKEVPREAFRSALPEAVAQTFEFLVDNGKDVVPFTDHVQKLTGQNLTFEQFIRNHIQDLI